MDTLFIINIALFSLVGLFLLFTKKRRSGANRFLGFFFLLWGLNFLDGTLHMRGFYLNSPKLAMWEEPFALLYGPLIYFYTQVITTADFELKKIHILHLVPFIIFLFGVSVNFHYQESDIQQKILSSILEFHQPIAVFLSFGLIFIHILLYFLSSKRLIAKHEDDLEQFYSNISLNWLKRNLDFLILIVLIAFISSIFQFYSPHYYFLSVIVVGITLLVFIVLVVYATMEQPELFINKHPTPGSSYILEESEKIQIKDKIKELMESQKIFKDPELTLVDLANQSNTTPRKLSYVINSSFNSNFFELVNRYRIEEAKKILKESDDPKITILEILYQVGFNSKSSFNTQFRKFTSQSPTEFRKSF